mmetsp:Transcript_46350/g.148519  ORF Transcript_46350/g.148519 Transcript_46350/m.148519 type:complete len:247 (-) Transcript_46350:162-902(-)
MACITSCSTAGRVAQAQGRLASVSYMSRTGMPSSAAISPGRNSGGVVARGWGKGRTSSARSRHSALCVRAMGGDYVPPKVADVMTTGQIMTCSSSTNVDTALEMLVDGRVTGLPVVDEDGVVVGVVSDYDLLALDSISNVQKVTTKELGGMFPAPDQSWGTFQELQNLLEKTSGQVVEDVMTPNPMVVRPFTNLEDASRLLLDKKFRRLPVVDEDGRLVGILTRGNVRRDHSPKLYAPNLSFKPLT